MVVFAPVLWLIACRIPTFADDVNLRIAVVSAMMAMLAAATAEEFWRGTNEPLMSRWPTVIVLLAYAAALIARIPATYFSPLLDNQPVMSGVSFALLAFGTLLFTVVMSFLLLNMTKERTELQHKINSLVDPLSGVANRRAFLGDAGQMLSQQAMRGEPLGVFLFDLDHFKQINDHLGHAVGDQVLQTFAQSATATLGAEALFGRIGGEEFACLIPVGDLGEAFAIGDRVRRKFAEAALRFADETLVPTVSVGVTMTSDCECRHRRLVGDCRPGALPRQGARAQSCRSDRASHRAERSCRRRAFDRTADCPRSCRSRGSQQYSAHWRAKLETDSITLMNHKWRSRIARA